MATCEQCKNFFGNDQDAARGDCVQRVVDPRQGYYVARPVAAEQDAGSCKEFTAKD